MTSGPEKIPVEIDTSKIGNDPETRASRKRYIAAYLLELGEQKPFGPDDLVVTLTGEYAEIALKVKEVRDDGVTVIIPKPGASEVEIPTSELFHSDDYREAFEASLAKEQEAGGFDTVN